jgi:hypothetical protein
MPNLKFPKKGLFRQRTEVHPFSFPYLPKDKLLLLSYTFCCSF